MPRGVRLDHVFRLEDHRTVSNDWVVRYDNRFFQLERQSHRPPARGTVVVCEDAAGNLEIRYRGRVMRWTEIPPSVAAGPPATVLTVSRSAIPRRAPLRSGPWRPSADHPWGRGFEQRAARRAEQVPAR